MTFGSEALADAAANTSPNTSTNRSAIALFVVLAACGLLVLGILGAHLPAAVRKPVLLPVAIFGLGGGTLLVWLAGLLRLRLHQTACLLVSFAGAAYAASGTNQLAAMETRDDRLAAALVEHFRGEPASKPGPLERWASWRWAGTSLGRNPAAAIGVYAGEVALAMLAAGWMIRRHRPFATSDDASPVDSSSAPARS